MESTKWYKNPEMIVAISALVIGVVTAATSIYSAYVDREYARASAWPRLEIFSSTKIDNGSDNHFNFLIMNSGQGPALIKYTKVQDGSTYIKSWAEIEPFEGYVQSSISTRTLPAQTDIVPVLHKGKNARVFQKAVQSLSIELCYCSIYAECWVVDRQNAPTTVEACSIDDEQRFQH